MATGVDNSLPFFVYRLPLGKPSGFSPHIYNPAQEKRLPYPGIQQP